MFSSDLGDGAQLRPLEVRHAAALLAFTENNRAFLSEYLGWAITMKSEADAAAFIRRGLVRYSEDGLPWIGIWQDDALVGGILFFPHDKYVNATEVGYWLGQQSTGKGLMNRAMRAVLAFVFDDFALNRLMLRADVGNTASRRLAERLGFQLEGIERQGWFLHGQYTDLAAYAMLKSDWLVLKEQ
jgi:ribosomal-protein-serine acetyltransferase